jgi:hypothetical protein
MTTRFNPMLLDEAQGLTSAMVATWLDARGWQRDNRKAFQLAAPPIDIGCCFRKGEWLACTDVDLGAVVGIIASAEGVSVQTLLRQLNPRMSKGPPSKAARDAARPCYWLASWTAIGRIGANLWDSDMMDHFADSPEIVEWFFWPCDAAANKVRWPVDEKGVML